MKFLLTGMYSDRDDETAFATQPLNGNTNAAFFPDAVVPTQPYHVASPLRDHVGQLYVKQKAVSLKTDWDLGDDVGQLTSLTSYLDIQARLIVPISAAQSPSCVASFQCIIYDEGYPSKTFQEEVTFTSRKFGRLSFVAGAMYYNDKNTLVSNINPPLTAAGDVVGPSPVFYLTATVKTNAAAGFGEATYNATDRLHFIAGLRYSWERRYGSGNLVAHFPSTGPVVSHSWTPRLSARYDVTSHANVYFTFSQGFKSPVLDSSSQTDDSAKPEKVTSYEVGVKVGTPTFNLSADAFYYDYRDLQIQFFNNVATILSNAESAKIWGFEADGSVQITPSLGIHLTGAWLAHAQYGDFRTGVAFQLPNSAAGMSQVIVDASGQRMLKTPRFTGSASVNYETVLPNDARLDFNATYSFVSHYWFDLLKRVDTGNYGILNGSIGYSPAHSGLRLSVFGKNLTGKTYFTGTLLGSEADAPVYNPPRQIGAAVDFKF